MDLLRHAFKEWAVICEALGKGYQTLILRKGGILEIESGFRVEHERFWLFPTYVHQQESGVVQAALPLLKQVKAAQPPRNVIHLSHFAEVHDVYRLEGLEQALALGGLHFWSEETVRQRFAYKRPGLFALLVRVGRVPRPIELPNTPYYDGCKSWVELEQEPPTEGSQPVLIDSEFEKRREAIRVALHSVSRAGGQLD